MIPSDHFVRYYNEVFKALEEKGVDHLRDYWRELGRLQGRELAERFRTGGLQAAFEYWSCIKDEENCVAELELIAEKPDERGRDGQEPDGQAAHRPGHGQRPQCPDAEPTVLALDVEDLGE